MRRGRSAVKRPVKRRFGLGATFSGVLAFTSLIATGGCQTSVPFREVFETPFPVAWSRASEEQIDEAIWRAGRKQSWEIEDIGRGHLRATRRWKRYVVVVSITHDRHQLRVAYADSENLRRSEGQIHQSYDRLVRRLVAGIEREPLVAGANSGSRARDSTPQRDRPRKDGKQPESRQDNSDEPTL